MSIHEYLVTGVLVLMFTLAFQLWYVTKKVIKLHERILKDSAPTTDREPLRELKKATDKLEASEEEQRLFLELFK